ncbi:7535_t:CDS:2, partial [Rhizophagus irregularis]
MTDVDIGHMIGDQEHLVDTYDANFPLEGRDESIKILFKGSKGRNGICKIFEKRKSRDSNLHPIPILANGPGTVKSRLLQELPTLLREQAKNYTTDSELLKMSTIKCTPLMLPLAMILLHQKKTFILVKQITNAIDVILKDVNKDRDEYNKIKFFVLGIDELNALYSLYDKNLDPVRNQVNLI